MLNWAGLTRFRKSSDLVFQGDSRAILHFVSQSLKETGSRDFLYTYRDLDMYGPCPINQLSRLTAGTGTWEGSDVLTSFPSLNHWTMAGGSLSGGVQGISTSLPSLPLLPLLPSLPSLP